MFAVDNIAKDEIVFIKGGRILQRKEMYTSSPAESYLPIDDYYVIGARLAEDEYESKLFVNHSCSPNCGVRGEITFIAIREIIVGEELTIDYAMVDNEPYEFQCECGSICCRGVVTGMDWKLECLQRKYGQSFSRYLLEKILSQSA
jgi:hypothetical protein